MLILRRLVGQRIAIDVNGVRVWVILTAIDTAGRAAIGIDAPPKVVIEREERLARATHAAPSGTGA